MHLDSIVQLHDNGSAQTHLSRMFTAIISKLDRHSRETLSHVLHHCHTRLSPQTHLPVMFFSERDDVTYAIAAPHLNREQKATDPLNSKLCHVSQHSWGDVESAAVRLLNGTSVNNNCICLEEHELQHENQRPASTARPVPLNSTRQRENYPAYAPLNESMNESDSDDADDFDDELSYDSYLSDSKMSDVTEDAEDNDQRSTRVVIRDESEIQRLPQARQLSETIE